MCQGFHTVKFTQLDSDRVGSSRIDPDLIGVAQASSLRIEVGLTRIGPDFLWTGFTLAHLASYCCNSVGCFSQHTATKHVEFLYLGSFRKNMFPHRELSNPKCSVSNWKTRFPGFDRVHHLGSFCKTRSNDVPFRAIRAIRGWFPGCRLWPPASTDCTDYTDSVGAAPTSLASVFCFSASFHCGPKI